MKPPMDRAALTRPLVPQVAADDPHLRGSRVLLALFAGCRSPHTRRSYADDFELFARFIRQGYGRPLSPAQVVEALLWGGSKGQTNAGHANELAGYYQAFLLQREQAPATVNRRCALLRGLVRAGRQLGFVSWALERRSLKVTASRDTRGPAVDAVGAMAAVLEADGTLRAIRDLAIVRLLFDLGLRRGEVAALNVSDVNLRDGELRIKGKGRLTHETLSLPPVTVKVLATWLAVRSLEPGPVFCMFRGGLHARLHLHERMTGAAIYKQIRVLGRSLGLHVRPHGLRHTAITTAIVEGQRAGIDLTEVLQFSRHANISTLMIYRDRTRNVQGRLAGLVANAIAPGTPMSPETDERPGPHRVKKGRP